MSNELKKAAEILVECRYADDINQDHLAFAHQCGPDGSDIDWEFRPCDPFADTLEGRRQADAIEGRLFNNNYKLWGNSYPDDDTKAYTTQHQWRLDRIKWCLEQLTGEDNEQKPNS